MKYLNESETVEINEAKISLEIGLVHFLYTF
jgi:hypothetical protein